VRRVSALAMVRRLFGVEAKGSYTLSTWPCHETCRSSQMRRMRRESSERACAASSRDGAPRPLSHPVADEKCVPAHRKRGKKVAPPTVCSYSTARTKRARKTRCPPPKSSVFGNFQSVVASPKFGGWAPCFSMRSKVGEIFWGLKRACL